jgi:hypothetical protein
VRVDKTTPPGLLWVGRINIHMFAWRSAARANTSGLKMVAHELGELHVVLSICGHDRIFVVKRKSRQHERTSSEGNMQHVTGVNAWAQLVVFTRHVVGDHVAVVHPKV